MRLRSGDRSDLNMADRSRRNPGKDVLDLTIRQRDSAQDGEHVGSRFPTFLVPDHGEISPLSPGYTGN